MDEAFKEQLAAQFRAYLNSTEESAAGAPDSEATAPPLDLFTLFSEVTALKNEVKLEARTVGAALDEFRGLFDELRQANTRLAGEQRQRLDLERRAEQRAQKELLLELLDLRDRLEAGRDQAARFRPGWLQGRAAAGFVASMAEGMAMNLRRLDEILTRRDVRGLQALGKPFDPYTMSAAELVRDATRDEGVVVQELRKGYLQQDQLLRAAEVVVNRPEQPANGP